MSPSTLENRNCFDLLRALAAWAVLYSHSYPLLGLKAPQLVTGWDLGNLAVAFFFSISGFLVCQSWGRDPQLLRFATRRALRVLPGLIIALLFTAFVIGPAFTTETFQAYFARSEVWLYMPKALQLAYTPRLPGVFEHNAFAYQNNGSLWTLRYEVSMYACLALLGFLLPKQMLKPACATLLAGFAFGWWLHATGYGSAVAFANGLSSEWFCLLGVFFFAGSCLRLYFNKVPLSLAAAVLMLAASAMVPNPTLTVMVLWVAVPYAAIALAYRLPQVLQKLNGSDYSYGIYIYAFPIQQAVAQTLPGAAEQRMLFVALTTAATLACAVLSWHFVEAPALAMKDRLIRPGRRTSGSA